MSSHCGKYPNCGCHGLVGTKCEELKYPMNWIKAIFTKPRYEFRVLMSHENYVKERVEALQDEGWVLCGEVLVRNSSGHCTETFLHIPFKRRIR